MKTLTALCVAAAAGSAMASPTIDRSTMTIYDLSSYEAVSLDATPSNSFAGSAAPIYSNMDPGTGFVSLPAGPGDVNGVIGFDDYTSTATGNQFMTEFRFVGGVQEANGVMFFDFFDAAGAFVDGFGVRLSMAGNFIYTINLSSSVEVAAAGFAQASVDATGAFGVATTGQWFASDGAATVGANGPSGDLAQPNNHNFEMSVPAPGAVALLGLSGLVAARRRRA